LAQTACCGWLMMIADDNNDTFHSQFKKENLNGYTFFFQFKSHFVFNSTYTRKGEKNVIY
jgi:hypothetical protein